MKKKNLILFTLFIFFCSNLLKAQEDIEFMAILQENRVWSIQHEKHVLIGDTVINEQTYKKLFFHNYLEELTPDSLQYIAALREDSTNTKVYYIFHGEVEEHLLYDFSLEVGEEFEVKSPIFNYSGPEFLEINDLYPQNIQITEIKDTIIGEVERKAYHVNNMNEYENSMEWWIEGIGSTMGLLYAGNLNYLAADKEFPFLLCFHDDNILVYQDDSPFNKWADSGNSCYALPATNIQEIEGVNGLINPTIFHDEIKITIHDPIQSITIYHQSGRVVYNAQAFHDAPYNLNITTQDWQRGLYIVSLQKNNKVSNYKVIKY